MEQAQTRARVLPARVDIRGEGRRLVHFAPEALIPSVDQVARYFGGARYRPTGGVLDRIKAGIRQVGDLIRPKAYISVFTARGMDDSGRLLLDGSQAVPLTDLEGPESSPGLAAAAIALGGTLETRCRELASEEKIFESTLMDAIGTGIMDALAEACQDEVERQAGDKGLFLGLRLSPGLDDFPLERQAELMEMIEPDLLGITLNECFVMNPAKSLSWFNLLTDTPKQRRCGHKCAGCALKNCQFRQRPSDENILEEAV